MAGMTTRRGNNLTATLSDSKYAIPPGERDIRLEDYLNDKIQTASDLGNLDALIANVENQAKQLEQQHKATLAALENSRRASAEYRDRINKQTRSFDKQHEDIKKRLMIVTSSDTPEEAATRLRGPLEKLRRVELARSYVELLKDVDDLANTAKSHLPASPKEALKPYAQLKELSIILTDLQEPAEGAALHLVNHVQTTSAQLWEEMKGIMSKEFESVLQEAKWPELTLVPNSRWTDCFGRLLDLQSPEILNAREPLILLPVGVLANSFIQQFRYHFFSNKSTNTPHALGTYFFPWFLSTVDNLQYFLRENITPVLAEHFLDHPFAGNSLYMDPVAAFITALLPVVKEKVFAVVAQVSHEPEYLSKFIIELMDFDDSVRNKFSYDGGNFKFGWKGITWDVLDTNFDEWSLVEKNFALQRYQEIIRSPDAGKIDYDGAPAERTKYTYGAAKVTDLVSNVTSSYNKLRKFSHKVRFLISIQAEILDHYLGYLKDSLEAYQAATSAVGRTLHGVTKEQQAALEGVGGLESLCKVLGSAEHLIAMLKEWSNDEFFIELWDELQERAKTTDVRAKLAGSMSYMEVKDVTSNAVGSEDEGSLFDVTIDGYERIRSKAEDLIQQFIKYSFPTMFKQYLTKAQWTTIGDISAFNSDLAITAELDLPLQTLKHFMTFLHRVLSTPTYRRIWRVSLLSLQDLLYDELLLKQDFTSHGSARLQQDVISLSSLINSFDSFLHMPKLAEGVHLLSLPLEKRDGYKGVTLPEASQELFSSNAQAEAILKRLGLGRISNYDGRNIIQRRVEAND